ETCAETESEGDHGDEGEARARAQRPDGVAEVLEQCLEHGPSLHREATRSVRGTESDRCGRRGGTWGGQGAGRCGSRRNSVSYNEVRARNTPRVLTALSGRGTRVRVGAHGATGTLAFHAQRACLASRRDGGRGGCLPPSRF